MASQPLREDSVLRTNARSITRNLKLHPCTLANSVGNQKNACFRSSHVYKGQDRRTRCSVNPLLNAMSIISNYMKTISALLELHDDYAREETPGDCRMIAKYITLVGHAIPVRNNSNAARELCSQATNTPNVSTIGEKKLRRALLSNRKALAMLSNQRTE